MPPTFAHARQRGRSLMKRVKGGPDPPRWSRENTSIAEDRKTHENSRHRGRRLRRVASGSQAGGPWRPGRCPRQHGAAGPRCGRPLESIPTSEDKALIPTSIYAITKRDHEELCLVTGAAYGIPAVALRFFNVYGPGQALSNPYTGVAAIFASRLLNGRPPVIFEDGRQSRTSSTSA